MSKILIIITIVLGVGGGALFLLSSRGVDTSEVTEAAQEDSILKDLKDGEVTVVLKNQGGDMEGHTLRSFPGMGAGLFAGDNLNPGFPDGEGVQIFLTFDLNDISLIEITSATLKLGDLQNLHLSGSPFQDLGILRLEEVRYDNFSADLWNLETTGFNCLFAQFVASETESILGPFECDVASVVQRSLDSGYRYAQFRIFFDKAGDEDGVQDLAFFYITDSNTNEPGIFELVVSGTK